MPWLRVGDTAASHPVVLRAWSLPEADARLKNELFGFVAMCAAMSAAFKTDYVVEMGTVVAVAGFERGRVLADAAVACGYFSVVEGEQGQTLYRIIDDPELFHMRLKDEIEWENRQRNDTRNKNLTVPVRARDGDACRWCGRVVYWGDQKSLRGATYDHVDAGRAAESVNDLVVSCRGCNSARKNNEAWGKALLPEPKKPYYAQKTVDFLAENGVRVALSPESEKPLVDRGVALADAGAAGSDGGLMLSSCEGGGDCAPAPEASGVRDCPAPNTVVDDESSACSSLPATDAFHNVRLPITPNLTPTDSDSPGRVGTVSHLLEILLLLLLCLCVVNIGGGIGVDGEEEGEWILNLLGLGLLIRGLNLNSNQWLFSWRGVWGGSITTRTIRGGRLRGFLIWC